MSLILGDIESDPEVMSALAELISDELHAGRPMTLVSYGKSMGSTLPQGSRVKISYVPFEKMRIGDIALIQGEHHWTLHRIVAKKADRFKGDVVITRGDALFEPDPPHSAELVLGIVTHITRTDGQTEDLTSYSGLLWDRARGLQTRGRILHGILQSKIQWLAVRCSDSIWLSPWVRAPYSFAIRSTRRSLLKIPQVQDVILYRSLSGDRWTPGLSDIDLWVVIDDLDPQNRENTIRAVYRKHSRLKRYYPHLGQLVVTSRKYFELWSKYGGIRAIERDRWSPARAYTSFKDEYVRDPQKLALDYCDEILITLKHLTAELRRISLDPSRWRLSARSIHKHLLDVRRWKISALNQGAFYPTRSRIFLELPVPLSKRLLNPSRPTLTRKLRVFLEVDRWIWSEIKQGLGALGVNGDAGSEITRPELDRAGSPSGWTWFIPSTDSKQRLRDWCDLLERRLGDRIELIVPAHLGCALMRSQPERILSQWITTPQSSRLALAQQWIAQSAVVIGSINPGISNPGAQSSQQELRKVITARLNAMTDALGFKSSEASTPTDIHEILDSKLKLIDELHLTKR